MMTSTLTLGVLAMFSGFFAQPRMSERALADIAVIRVPRMVKEEQYTGIRLDQPGRITFTFGTTFFWASFASSTYKYKHQLFISLMAPDATEGEYKEPPRNWSASYDRKGETRRMTLGSGSLTISEGIYVENTIQEPGYVFSYVDKARRLVIDWHAVKKEIGLDDAIAAIEQMASSFRIKREPTAEWTEMRDMPRKAEEERLKKIAMMRETLIREGFGDLQPGKPVFKDGVYVEYMTDPEHRVQLLMPLGRVRVPTNVTPTTRPRPVSRRAYSKPGSRWPGTIGWREFADGEWTMSNNENDYLPFPGIRAELAKGEHDPASVEFYWSATTRVEVVIAYDQLRTLNWFFDAIPAVKEAWAEGRLTR